jgi:phosphatidylglycerophosphate synthase
LNPSSARRIADGLTWSRIVSILPITVLAVMQLRWWVFTLYIAAALTDLLDGRVARHATPAANDVDLDGIADLALSIATLFWLWLLVPGFVSSYWLPYLPVFVALEIYMATIRLRHADFRVPHLPFGRFAMALFFSLLPVLLVFGNLPWFVHGVLLIGAASKLQLALAFWNRQPV